MLTKRETSRASASGDSSSSNAAAAAGLSSAPRFGKTAVAIIYRQDDTRKVGQCYQLCGEVRSQGRSEEFIRKHSRSVPNIREANSDTIEQGFWLAETRPGFLATSSVPGGEHVADSGLLGHKRTAEGVAYRWQPTQTKDVKPLLTGTIEGLSGSPNFKDGEIQS